MHARNLCIYNLRSTGGFILLQSNLNNFIYISTKIFIYINIDYEFVSRKCSLRVQRFYTLFIDLQCSVEDKIREIS